MPFPWLAFMGITQAASTVKGLSDAKKLQHDQLVQNIGPSGKDFSSGVQNQDVSGVLDLASILANIKYRSQQNG